MSHSFAIASRRVLAGDGLRDAAVVIEGERIVGIFEREAVSPEVPVSDFGDLVVMAGVVDANVRIGEPGRAEWEGFEHATRAAAAGGITTLGDLPLPCRPVTGTIEALEAKRWAARGKLHVDVGLHVGLLPGYQDQIEPLADAGALTFMAYLIDPGLSDFRQVGATDLESAMPVLARRGVPLMVHSEMAPSRRPAADPDTDVRSYSAYRESRPSRFELDAIEQMVRLCRETGCQVHVTPLASAHTVPALRMARIEGLPISAGTTPHHLSFAAEEIPDGDPRFKCMPPIRGSEHREGLWAGLTEGVIDCVSSDHSPAPAAKRRLVKGDVRRAWGGISSLQLLLPALWTSALSHGKSLVDLGRWLSRQPASLLGLGSRKGRLAAGYDADLVVWEPEATFEVVGADLEHRFPHTPWAGSRLFGVVHQTLVRGQVVYAREEGFGDPRGQLVQRLD